MNKYTRNFILIALVVLVPFSLIELNRDTQRQAASAQRVEEPRAGSGPSGKGDRLVTQAAYDQLHVGMTPNGVSEVIGFPGRRDATRSEFGIPFHFYEWKDSRGNLVYAGFIGNWLYNKTLYRR